MNPSVPKPTTTGFCPQIGSDRILRTQPSPIRAFLDRAAELRAAGRPVISFSAGEPNFDTPMPIKQATIEALSENLTHYGSNRGLFSLRKAVASLTLSQTGVSYDPEEEILITCGGAEALNNAILALISDGDEVILPTPAFVTYQNLIRFAGGRVVEVPLLAENGFQPDPTEIAHRITPRTRMLILNNPNNPSGAVYPYETLSALSVLAVKHNFLILSDEMYSRLVYDGSQFTSIATFPGMRERSIIVNGFSKTYAMTGWRLGYLLAEKKLLRPILRMHQYDTTCAPTFLQEGLARALSLPETEDAAAAMRIALEKRRSLMLAGLSTLPNMHPVTPLGAFYILLDVTKTGLDCETFSRRLLEEFYVATVPASGMGRGGEGFVRLSYAASDEDIREGLLRMQAFAEKIKKE